MFTGLVEGRGQVLRVDRQTGPQGSATIEVSAPCFEPFDVRLGDSVAVNGCCLTVRKLDADSASTMSFQIGHETLACTNLGAVQAGNLVNVERALRMGDRLGGHMVYGHVDTTAKVVSWHATEKDQSAMFGLQAADTTWELDVELDARFAPYCVEKGSMCIDGVSLTIQRIQEDLGVLRIGFMIIAATREKTHFASFKIGSRVNIEVDVMAKWVEKMMQTSRKF